MCSGYIRTCLVFIGFMYMYMYVCCVCTMFREGCIVSLMFADQVSHMQNIADPKYFYSYADFSYQKLKQGGVVADSSEWTDGIETVPRAVQVSSVSYQHLHVVCKLAVNLQKNLLKIIVRAYMYTYIAQWKLKA